MKGIYALVPWDVRPHLGLVNWESIVADNIRAARKAKGMTQEQLAELAGLDLRYLGSIERGKGNPSVNILGRLAAALKVKPYVLLKEPSEPNPWG